MKTLTIANRKGGVGKSTCAAHLAVEATRRGFKTLLIDLDPQKTLENWWNRREEDDIPLLEIAADDLLSKLSAIKAKGFDLCIIDTPGDMSEHALKGIEVADLVLIPSKPTAPDLNAVGRTLNLLKQDNKKFVFLVTQGVSSAKSTFQASALLSDYGVVAPSPLSNRVSYQRAMGQGSSAAESDKVAKEEIEKIWLFIEGRLFEQAKPTKEKLTA